MPDKRYYWIKLKSNFFDLEAIDWLQSQTNGCEYIVLYQKLCLIAANKDGRLLTEIGEMLIPYDVNKIARDTKFNVDTVVVAMELFKKLNLIYQQDDGIISIPYVDEIVGSECESAQRVRKYRKERALQCNENVTDKALQCNVEYRDKEIRDIDNKIIEKEYNNARARADAPADEEKTTDKVPYKKIMDLYHSICKSYPTIRDINGERKKAVAARYKANPDLEVFKRLFEKAEASKFLQGNNDRNWKADFDFLMHAAKFDRVLEGKYDDSEQQKANPVKPTSYDISEREAITMNKYQKAVETGVLDFNFEVKK